MHSVFLIAIAVLLCTALLCTARQHSEIVDHSLSAFQLHTDAFKDAPSSPTFSNDIFQRLHHLVELVHTYGNEQRAGFDAVLEPGIHYITHGTKPCYGITDVVACLLKEHRTNTDHATLQQQYETLAVNTTQVVRMFSQIRMRGAQPRRELDVFFVRLNPITRRIAVLEHIGPIDDAVDVQTLVDRRRNTP